jgi:1,4-alpha-glucan branching enzyme
MRAASDLLARKSTHFVLWRPRNTTPAPRLIIGRFQPGDPPAFIELPPVALRQSSAAPDLWEIPAGACGLEDGRVYHYWFEVLDSNPYLANRQLIRCTDPTAWTVDWRLLAPPLPAPYGEHDRDPAGVVKFSAGRLVPCDPGGEEVDWSGDRPLHVLPTNNRLVIYELPTAWARIAATDAAGRHETQIGVGTFRDVIALIDRDHAGANFAGCCALEAGRAHLADLGVNALELLPPADSFVDREWGYATSNYFAADYDLGIPTGQAAPTASTDLVNLVKICHQHGLRFFADMVLAFATRYSYQNVNYLDFHVQAGAGDPEEFDQGTRRDAFGGDLFKYNFWTEAYDPVSGRSGQRLVPARRLMHAHLARWMLDFRIDGIRLDSVKSIANWDVVQEVRDHAHALWRSRWPGADDAHEARIGHVSHDAESRFLVIGEELAVPMALLAQNRLDGLWNEHFKRLVRRAITGRGDEHEASFEWAVREMIDCRLLGFRDGTQAVNYVTSHDVEGFGNERLFNFLNNSSIPDTEPRIKLAFACLMTAVGVPMIFAGEEFADEHDRRVRHPEKQVDPVNFDRVEDPWRRRIYEYVARLVKFRTTSEALAVNDTDFVHADFTEGKRVVVWRRGPAARADVVVVVANFSDWGSDVGNPRAEYVVPNWPATPPGMRWREISQDREVPVEWIGREPLYPWEAKVYALV